MNDTATITKTKIVVATPTLWNVVLHNDDFTPIDFVMFLLANVFAKTHEEAAAITMDVHLKGKGIVGTYTREIAETKVMQVVETAKANEHPLLATAEPA